MKETEALGLDWDYDRQLVAEQKSARRREKLEKAKSLIEELLRMGL